MQIKMNFSGENSVKSFRSMFQIRHSTIETKINSRGLKIRRTIIQDTAIQTSNDKQGCNMPNLSKVKENDAQIEKTYHYKITYL